MDKDLGGFYNPPNDPARQGVYFSIFIDKEHEHKEIK